MINKNIVIIDSKKIIIFKNNNLEEIDIRESSLLSLKEVLTTKFLPTDYICIFEGSKGLLETLNFNIQKNVFYLSSDNYTSLLQMENSILQRAFDFILEYKIDYLIIHFLLNIFKSVNIINYEVIETDFGSIDNLEVIKSRKFYNSINNIMDNLDIFNNDSSIIFDISSFMDRNHLNIRDLDYNSSIPFIKIYNRLDANSEVFLKSKDINKDINDVDLPIVFISDSNQFKYCAKNIEKIKKQTSSDPIFYIVLVDVNNKQTEKFKKILSEIIDLQFVNIINVNLDDFNINVSKLKNITPTANIMLYLPDILKDLKRVLYLDVDTVVLGDISSLRYTFKDDLLYVKQTQNTSRWLKKLSSFYLYHANKFATHNTGVVHFPLEKMRNGGFVEKAEFYFYNNHKRIRWVDQDILDSIWPIKDLKWNLNIARSIWPKHHVWNGSLDSVRIYHFLNKNKQWTKINFSNPKVNKFSLTKNEIISHRLSYKLWNEERILNRNSRLKLINVLANNQISIDSLFYWDNLQREFNDILKIKIFVNLKIYDQLIRHDLIEKKGFKVTILPINNYVNINSNDNEITFNFKINDRIKPDKLLKYKKNTKKLF